MWKTETVVYWCPWVALQASALTSTNSSMKGG